MFHPGFTTERSADPLCRVRRGQWTPRRAAGRRSCWLRSTHVVPRWRAVSGVSSPPPIGSVFMKAEANLQTTGLSNVLVAASLRGEQWRQLNALGRSWNSLGDSPKAATARTQCKELLGTISRIEHCWAYPGDRLLGALRKALDDGDAGEFSRLAGRLSAALLTGDFRRDAAVWDPDEDTSSPNFDALPPDILGGDEKPYFEVLVVTPTTPSTWQRSKDEMRRMRRPDDQFNYEAVHVGSFEDAVLAVIANSDLQSVVLADGFGYESRHDIADLKQFLARHLGTDLDTPEPGALSLTLANRIKDVRPELDLFLISDRSPELLAGSDSAAPIRRVFHHVEEPMELHLSLLDGVKDRYDTPYFDNLQKYAQRPIGTFHALPIARGKSIFGSNWIRDMGRFYGTNILFAESSATTGGLDSLLEPTGNIKKAQEACARAFGAKRAYLGTNGTSRSEERRVGKECRARWAP